jgi:hypothetical protein
MQEVVGMRTGKFEEKNKRSLAGEIFGDANMQCPCFRALNPTGTKKC